MFSIKALIFFAVMLSTLAAFAGQFSKLNSTLEDSAKKFQAKTDASGCAQIINSFYSNSGGQIKNYTPACYVTGSASASTAENIAEKKSGILNNSTAMAQKKNSTEITVKVAERYG